MIDDFSENFVAEFKKNKILSCIQYDANDEI